MGNITLNPFTCYKRGTGRSQSGRGAAVAGAEGGSGRAVGHAVLHSPGHSLGAEGVGLHVGEAVHRSGCGAHGAIQEGHALAAVQVLLTPKVPSARPFVMPFSSAHATAS